MEVKIKSITAVMVTGLERGVPGLPQMAVQCFLRQTHPIKELLVINHGDQNFTGENVRDIKVHKREDQNVGALRNIAFKLSNGDYLMNWDDDDWQHPDRMAWQSERTPDGHLSALKNWIVHRFESGESFYLTKKTGYGATMMYPRNTTERYQNVERGSDTWFKCMFLERRILDNDPGLYIYNLHGKNLTQKKDTDRFDSSRKLSAHDLALVSEMKHLLTTNPP